jgi:cytochrome oxidase assembly protein ShyY1
LAQQLDGDVVMAYVDMTASAPADTPLLEPVARPDLSEGPHRGYAVQWFIFTVCVAVGWVLAVRRSVRTNQRNRAEADAQAQREAERQSDESRSAV